MFTDKPNIIKQTSASRNLSGEIIDTSFYPHPQGVGRGCIAAKAATNTLCKSVFIRGSLFFI